MLFDEWLAANELWSQSKMLISIRTRKKDKKLGSRRWMTHAEIVKKYEDEKVASAIVAHKESLEGEDRKGSVRPHPDCPELSQYFVFDEEYESTETDTVLDSMFKAVEDSNKSKGRKRKASSSSSSSSGSSDSSSESSEKKSKKSKKKSKKGGKKSSKKDKAKAKKAKDKKKNEEKLEKEKKSKEEKDKNTTRNNAKKAGVPFLGQRPMSRALGNF